MSAATTTQVSPLSAKVRSPRTARDLGAPSPNYFSSLVSPPAPSEPHPDFDAFRRRSESNPFSLSHGNLSTFSASSGSRNASNEASPAGSREREGRHAQPPRPHAEIDRGLGKESQIVGKETQTEKMDIDPPSPSHPSPTRIPSSSPSTNTSATSRPSLLDAPRYESPSQASVSELSALRRSQISTIDERHPRNSLPHNRIDPPSPPARNNPVYRAVTLPGSLSTDGPSLISPQDFLDARHLLPPDDILLLDVRVFPQYSQSRVDGALNLCIPTTLLKRPAFNAQKLADTFTKEKESAKFARWREATMIVVYDASSVSVKDATTCVNTLKKFSAEGWHGSQCILRGGFQAFSKKFPDLIDRRPADEMEPNDGRKLSIDPQLPLAAPVAGGCLMPSNQTAANPFFGTIRQNMDLIGGVGQISIKVPHYLRQQGRRYLPLWLKEASDEGNAGKRVADRFLKIEQGEQHRMQKALTSTVHYGTPRTRSPSAVKIAGIEKGTKNRYKDMLPYDHSRVRLQNVPAGECDYINASHINSSLSQRHYIASQAPVPATIEDFWRVVWEQGVYVIIMLTAEHDGGQRKSHPYWNGTFGDYVVSVRQTQKAPINGSDSSNNDLHALVRDITISRLGQSRSITQVHYASWPDFGVPTEPGELLGVIDICENVATSHDERGPTLVHCSAGCGRTGTFCTVDSVIQSLKTQISQRPNGRIADLGEDHKTEDLVARTVEDFRLQRLSMVQTLRQFVLCYETMLAWFEGQLQLEGLH